MDKKPYANNMTLLMPANQMRVLKNQVSMLGRAIGNIFLPIVAKVLPYLNQLVYALRELAEWIVKLLGFEDFDWGNATGADNSAIGDLLDDTEGVSDNLDKAADNAKKFKAQLQGFDKLNNLTTTDDSGTDNGGAGAGGIDTGLLEGALDDALSRYQKRWDEAFKNMNQSFSTFADNVKKAFEEGGLYGVGQYFAKTMTDALNSIPWDDIKEKAGQAGKAIAEFLNGLTDPELFAAIGKTFVEGINTAFTILNEFIKEYDFLKLGESIAAGLNAAMDTIDWDLIFDFADNAGKKLADFVNGITKDVDFGKAGETVANGLSSITRAVQKFVEGVKWDELGVGLGNFVNGLTEYDWEGLGNTVGGAISGLFETINNVIKTVKFDKIGSDVASSLYTAFTSINFSQITGTISGAFSGLYDLLSGILDGINWESLPRDIKNKILEAFRGFDFSGIASSMGEYGGKLIRAIFNLTKGLAEVFGDVANTIKNYFVDKIKAAGWDRDNSLLENGVALIKGIFNGIIGFYAGIGTWIKDNIIVPFINGIASGITGKKTDLVGSGSEIIKTVFDGIVDFIRGIGSWLKTNVFDKVVDAFKGATSWFSEVGTTIWNGITNAFGTVSKTITATVTIAKGATFDAVKVAWDSIRDKAATLTAKAVNSTQNVLSTIKGAWDTVNDKVATLTAKAKNNAEKVISTLKSAWDTVKNKTSTLTGKAKNPTDKILSALKGAWDTVKNKTSTLTGKAKNSTGTVLSALKSAWNTIKEKTVTLTGKAKNANNSVLTKLKNGWSSITNKTATLTATFNDLFSAPLKAAWNAIANTINAGINQINKILPKKNKISKLPTLATGGYIPNGGGQIKRYASGGIPDIGTLFIAGEAGAEVVANARGGTEVLNESQIAASIAAGVADANAQQNAIMRQQNQLLREEINVLHAILEKTGISTRDVFDAVRSENANYSRVNGHSAFA